MNGLSKKCGNNSEKDVFREYALKLTTHNVYQELEKTKTHKIESTNCSIFCHSQFNEIRKEKRLYKDK